MGILEGQSMLDGVEMYRKSPDRDDLDLSGAEMLEFGMSILVTAHVRRLGGKVKGPRLR